MTRAMPQPWRWAALGAGLLVLLWALVPTRRDLGAVTGGQQQEAKVADGSAAASLARLRALLALAPDRLDWRRELARAYEDVGKPNEAVVQWRRVGQARDASDEDRRVAARELIGHVRAAEGVAVLEALAEEHKLGFDELVDGANAAGAASLWPEAARLLGHAAEARPADPFPLEALARVEERQGHTEAAIAAWQRRLKLASPHPDPGEHLALAALLERVGRQPEALALLEADDASRSVPELRERASLAWLLGRPQQELAARQALYRLVPGDQGNRLALADRLGATGDPAGAERLYAEALAMSANDPDTLAELAMRRVDGNRRELAAPLLNRLRAMPHPPDAALEVLARDARATRPAEAARWLDQLHARGGGDPRSWLTRGHLAMRLGDRATAVRSWRQVLALVPAGASDGEARDVRQKAMARLAEGRRGSLAGVRSWAIFYGAKAPLGRLRQPDLLVLEPDQSWHPRQLRRPGQRILAYMSLGEINRSRPYFAALEQEPGALESPNPSWPGAIAVDPRSTAWATTVLDRLVPALMARGYDGLFLDTLDVAAALQADGKHPGAQAAMSHLVRQLRARNPGAILVANGGLALLPETGQLLDAVAVESVFTDYLFSPPTYRLRAPGAAKVRARDLSERIGAYDLPVFVIEYLPAERAAERERVAKAARDAGWVPYVGPIGLDALADVTEPTPSP